MADETVQQLREQIASQKRRISIPRKTGLSSPETKAVAQLIKELSDTEEQLELLVESERVAAVVRLQDELHPPQNSEDCPICLETINFLNYATISRFCCCGGWICKKCSNERMKKLQEEGFDEMYRHKCPLCRAKMPRDDSSKEIRPKMLEHANKGKAWAQVHVGKKYVYGTHGYVLDEKKGLKLIKESADQRHSDALLLIALACRTGTLEHERDESKYFYYLKEAADLGHPEAQQILGIAYDRQDKEKCLHYITLAASQGNPKACGMLGHLFMNANCGLPKSLILAKHYTEKSLEDESFDSISAFNFSFALFQLGLERYEGILEIPGYSPIPTILFWARKALKKDPTVTTNDFATKLISMLENQVKNHCANCRKEAEGSSFKRCVRCLGAWYCGKDCQVQHWKAGHKIDCIKRK
eukprot:scaffold4992_cov156-Skeletonema_dohrnii-CCMP3373.AAC.6